MRLEVKEKQKSKYFFVNLNAIQDPLTIQYLI